MDREEKTMTRQWGALVVGVAVGFLMFGMPPAASARSSRLSYGFPYRYQSDGERGAHRDVSENGHRGYHRFGYYGHRPYYRPGYYGHRRYYRHSYYGHRRYYRPRYYGHR